MNRIIATAIWSYIRAQLASHNRVRRFFRLDGFEDDIYRQFLDLYPEQAAQSIDPIDIRSTKLLPGYPQYVLEDEKSATWYRNHVQPDHALILIFNERTSDAQSLKDIFPVTEGLLSTDGAEHIIRAAFTAYTLSQQDQEILSKFLQQVRDVLLQPQLRDLVSFLSETHAYLQNGTGAMENAIAYALPALGLFRCREYANHIGEWKGRRLLETVYRGVRLGFDPLDEKSQQEFLAKIAEGEFGDESAYNGLSPDEKRNLLSRFVANELRSLDERLQVLQLDWAEVSSVLYKKARKTKAEKLQELAEELSASLARRDIDLTQAPASARDVIDELGNGQEPDSDSVESMLANFGELLPRSTVNKLRRVLGTQNHRTSDFVAGVTHLASRLLALITEPELTIRVKFDRSEPEALDANKAEAVYAFRLLHGGIENVIPSVRWELQGVWDLLEGKYDEVHVDENGEEKAVKVQLIFRVSVLSESQELQAAELIWEYTSEGSAAATSDHIRAEAEKLRDFEDTSRFASTKLRIPIYNTCTLLNKVGDLDLSRPTASLGTWFTSTKVGNLRDELNAALKRSHDDTKLAATEALDRLEETWGQFIHNADENGIFAGRIDNLLDAYENLLQTATTRLQGGQEAEQAFRALAQAWIVGPETFDEWAVVPFLHPLKLQWWQARARRFDSFIKTLLSADRSEVIADEKRFLQELNIAYGSAGHPCILALPDKRRLCSYLLPIHELAGYELYFPESKANIAYGFDPELVSEEESEQAAQVAANDLAQVVEDYIETYPFTRDGLEVYILQCRNGALPGLLVEKLDKIAARRQWTLRLRVIIHTTDRGAPLHKRVTDWLKADEKYVERPADAYFQPVILKVNQCSYKELFNQIEDGDLVILPDVLAENGQEIETKTINGKATPPLPNDYLPIYRARQSPFERGEVSRDIQLTPMQPIPSLLQGFYNVQWAAKERRPVGADVAFWARISLQTWQFELSELHRNFNWVVCYDVAVDRFLLEETFPEAIEVIRYSLGLGVKRRHNLTVSSSHRTQDIVTRRLKENLRLLLPNAPDDFRFRLAQKLVDEAKRISGDIVLRAAGPGAYLNELLGVVAAKHITEKRFFEQHPGALTAWIYVDDFGHWFDGTRPDLLFVALFRDKAGELRVDAQVIEAKCVGEANFDEEARSAVIQMTQGVNRLSRVFKPGSAHLDAPYWYDQLYQAIVGNLAVEREHMPAWEAFRARLPKGQFTLGMSGHTWIFCYDGEAGLTNSRADDELSITHEYTSHSHHLGRSELRKIFKELADADNIYTSADVWTSIPETTPASPSVEAIQPELQLPPLPSAHNVPSMERIDVTPLPSLVVATSSDITTWVQAKARDLGSALRSYGVRVNPINPLDADIGPSLVRFKVRLYPNEKIGSLQRIAADLQRRLALSSIPIIANVPSTTYVGIDIPRADPQIVHLMDSLDELPQRPVGYLPFLVGKTPEGRTIISDLSKLPHMLVAGTTGSGKTIFLYSLLVSLLQQYGPEQLALLIVDPKQTDFIFFEGLLHLEPLARQVIIEPEEAITWLDYLADDVLQGRTEVLRSAAVRNVFEYNERAPQTPIPPIVVVIDEYADLVQVLNKAQRQEFEQRLNRLAQRARNVGIHLVIATQRPSADIVTTTLKANLPVRIAFRLPTHNDSMTILGQSGAENLMGRGDMLYYADGQVERLQGFYISAEELEAFVSRWRTK